MYPITMVYKGTNDCSCPCGQLLGAKVWLKLPKLNFSKTWIYSVDKFTVDFGIKIRILTDNY